MARAVTDASWFSKVRGSAPSSSASNTLTRVSSPHVMMCLPTPSDRRRRRRGRGREGGRRCWRAQEQHPLASRLGWGGGPPRRSWVRCGRSGCLTCRRACSRSRPAPRCAQT
eukprot:scaffold210987_cov28-Tisochrysis_lutea.AAC.1